MRTFLGLALFVLFLHPIAEAQDGTLDLAFNAADNGHFRGDGAEGSVYATCVLPNGKILIGGLFVSYNGSKHQKLVRLHPNGLLDTTFNQGGVGIDGHIVHHIALQPDGKILIAGDFMRYNGVQRFGIARLNSDGSLDTGFNPGIVISTTGIYSLAVQPDGRILAGGSQYQVNGVNSQGITRFNSDGTVDTTFTGSAGAGIVLAVTVQSTGKVLIGGSFEQYNGAPKKYLARLNTNGTVDNTFQDGVGANGPVSTMNLHANDAFFIGGSFTSYNGQVRSKIAKIEANGSLDSSFVPDANYTQSVVLAIAPTQDNKVLIAGLGDGVYRLNPKGARDTSFNPNAAVKGYIQYSGGIVGATYNTVYSISTQPDGNYILAGQFTQYGDTVVNEIVRITKDGFRDTNFNRASGANSNLGSVLVQGDGKLVVSGPFFSSYSEKRVHGITRLLPDGSPDPAFNVNGTGLKWGAGMGHIYSSALQPDGKILIGGNFNRYNAAVVQHIARLLPNGYLDQGFNLGGTGTEGEVKTIALQPDGKILIGGNFKRYNTVFITFIARLLSDGTLDPTFTSPFGGSNSFEVDHIALQLDGKMIVTGNFEVFFSGTSRRYILRLLPNGLPDPSFHAFNNQAKDVVVQPDGKIVLSGTFTTYNNVPVKGLIRVNADGSLDNSFSTPVTAAFGSLLLLPGGKIIVETSGSFGGDTATILRLNDDGTRDLSFQPVSGQWPHRALVNTFSATFAMQADGKIIASGGFTDLNGIGRNRIARINNTISPVLTLGSVSPLLFCPGSQVKVPFTYAGLSAATTILAQLSDASGSFSNPVVIGTSSGFSQGEITVTIPPSTAPGTGYRIRLSSTSPAITSADNGAGIQVLPTVSNPTWHGAFSTDWNDARNWCDGVPSSTKDATIPAGTLRAPTISNNAQVKNISVPAGGILNMTTGGFLAIHGNLAVSGTFNAAGTVSFQGSAVQTVSGLTAANVVINGGGITLNGNLSITNALTLTQGHLRLGNYNLSLMGTTFGSVASHVVTDGTGAVTISAGNGIFSFPIGASETTYNPITINDFTPRSFSVRVVNAVTPTIAAPLQALNRTWVITPSSTSTNLVTIQFNYADTEGNVQFLPNGEKEVGIFSGSTTTVIPPGSLTLGGNPALRYVTLSTNVFGPLVLANRNAIQIVTSINPVPAGLTQASVRPAITNGQEVKLSIHSQMQMNIAWRVINASGQTFFTANQAVKKGENFMSLPTSHLPAGVYRVTGTTSRGGTIMLSLLKL